jgi:hypothetical protein
VRPRRRSRSATPPSTARRPRRSSAPTPTRPRSPGTATAGLTLLGPDYWATTTAPTLTGTATDANLASVVASWPGGSAPAVVTAPRGASLLAGLDIAGRDVTITATDRAGNMARRSRGGCAPTRPRQSPASAPRPSAARIKTSSSSAPPSSAVCVATTRTTATSPASATSLGPPTACDASAPSVVKFAYLLDEAPPYVTQSRRHRHRRHRQTPSSGSSIPPMMASALRARATASCASTPARRSSTG